MLVPQLIRERLPDQPVGSFLHVPRPSPDIFARLPWREEILLGEYVTVQHARHGSGSLVLSEFTGAAAELRDAVPCNPFDVEGLSQRIEHALRLPAATRRGALAAMASHVHRHDVHRWVAGQLADIAARGAAR